MIDVSWFYGSGNMILVLFLVISDKIWNYLQKCRFTVILYKNTEIGKKIELLFTCIGGESALLTIPISKIAKPDLTKCGSLILSSCICLKNKDTTNCGKQNSTRHPLNQYCAKVEFYLVY